MTRVCVRHPFERSETLCGQCGQDYCRDCVVYPNGQRKPALCVQCALARGGVRSTAAAHPAISRRELKKRLKERKAEDKALARLAREPAPIPPISNPFTPGWAFADDDQADPFAAVGTAGGTAEMFGTTMETTKPIAAPNAELGAAAPTAPETPVVPVPPAPIEAPPRAPTLADLLPTITPEELPRAALAELATAETDVEDDSDRKSWSLPTLRRREPEEEDLSRGSSEMIAWLDEVFAPKDQ
jgi:hypothetical protein